MPLPHAHALVTGASSGIGAALARRLSAEGVARLTLVARRRDRLEALAGELPGATVVVADLATDEGVERTVAALDGVDLLVNNAGFGQYGAFAEADPARLEAMLRLNCLTPLRLTRAALPAMIAKGRGAVVNISSGMALQPAPYLATYAASKTFTLYWSEALHEELGGQGVQVLAVCPGVTPTEFDQVAEVPMDRLWVTRLMRSSVDQVVDDTIDGLRGGRATVISGLSHGLLQSMGALSPRWVKRSLFAAFLRP